MRRRASQVTRRMRTSVREFTRYMQTADVYTLSCRCLMSCLEVMGRSNVQLYTAAFHPMYM